jgi:hypothetical protein
MRSFSSLRRSQLQCLMAIAVFALALPSLCTAQDDALPNLPELAGIRPGMSAQKAYEIMKAEAGGAQIGIGEWPTSGVSVKPVPEVFSVHIINKVPALTLEVWLTTPPSKQTVWAVGEILQYPDSNHLLISTAFASWRQKFGQPSRTTLSSAYWALDEQGRHQADPRNCFANTNISVIAPPGPVYQFTTALYEALPTHSVCDSFVDVSATLPYLTSADRYTSRIELLEVDRAARKLLIARWRELHPRRPDPPASSRC